MNELKLLEILKQIRLCLVYETRNIAMDFIEIELNNLKGITERDCKSRSQYCTECKNFNCNSNKNCTSI